MRISRLRDAVVMCQFLDCTETAVRLLANASTTPGGKSLAAYCEKHSAEFNSLVEEPPALLGRRPCDKATSPMARKAAS